MAEGQGDWRSEAFRRKVITQIDEAVRCSNTTMAKSSMEMENHVFHKAKTREEYLALVARLILHVKDFNNQQKNKHMMGTGMAPQQMAQGPGMPQQDPINALQNMAMSGSGLQQGQGMMPGNQNISQLQQQQATRQQLLQQQQQMMQQRNNQARPQLQRQDAFIVTSAQAVQPPVSSQQATAQMAGQLHHGRVAPPGVGVGRPAQVPVVDPQYHGGAVQTSSQGPQMSSQQGPIASPAHPSNQPAGSPMSMMPSPQPVVVPSPASSRGVMSGSAPSPGGALNTPGNPGSVGAVPSPASQSPDEHAYLEKLRQLSKYIDPLRRMIKKSEEDRTKDAEHRKIEISKMKNLLDILTNPTKRVPMPTLIKCEQVLERMQFGHKTPASVPTTSAQSMPSLLPMPASSHMCQPLLDSVAAHITSPMFNHTLQRTFGPSISALYGNPIRAPSPPAKKRRVEEAGKVSDVLQGEIARLDRRFKVKLDPMQHTGARSVHLVCKLDDDNLPSVPPILVTVPADYPESSPECATSRKDYESTPFLQTIQRALVTQLLDLPSRFSLTSLLDIWEMSVRKACAPVI